MLSFSSMQYANILPQRLARWGVALILPVMLLVAGCSGGTSTKSGNVSPTHTPSSGTNTSTSLPAGTSITPVSGDFSVYVDPKWGYSFEYPSSWIVYHSEGNSETSGVYESNVSIMEPYTPDPAHPYTILTVRATNDFNADFAQYWVCTAQGPKDVTVNGFQAYRIDSGGGDFVNGLNAPRFGRAFSGKNLGFLIILQSSARLPSAVNSFFSVEYNNFNHIISTFQVGPGASQLVHGC
jgi:hypothetical protein